MKKKVIASVVAGVCCMTLAACGGAAGTTPETKEAETTESAVESAASEEVTTAAESTSASEAAEGSDVDYIKGKGTLVVGITDFEPMDYKDASGNWIGFDADLKDKYENDPDILTNVTIEDLKKFGMIPEFLGRLPIICTLRALDKDMLVEILKEPKNAILKQYQKLLAIDEVDLQFTDDALEAIADKAIERDTGARALRSIIEEFMLDIMYEIPKDDNIGRVTITGDYINGTGGPIIEVRDTSVHAKSPADA